MKLRILLLAPNIDGDDVGEAFVAFKWAEALSPLVDLTVLAFERPGRRPLAEQLPLARVVTWPEPAWARRHERLNAMLKPAYPVYCRHVRRWISGALAAGDGFDVAHQMMPLAARYASPLRHFDMPYVMGPVGGTLETPAGFAGEVGAGGWFTRLRGLDRLRMAWDPWLRRTYAQAALVLGVAPYIRDYLSIIPLRRFEPVLELGVDDIAPVVRRRARPGELNLLHVGRGVRTKGLRDVVRAMALLKDLPGVTLTSAGGGEEIEHCREEARRLGVEDRVTFLGPTPRAQVEELYREADVFAFPSFREPTGGVLYEAMSQGLPIISARYGGPDWIVDDECGVKLDVTTPEALAQDIAAAVRMLLADPERCGAMGAAARRKIASEGRWAHKAEAMLRLYHEVAVETAPHAAAAPIAA